MARSDLAATAGLVRSWTTLWYHGANFGVPEDHMAELEKEAFGPEGDSSRHLSLSALEEGPF